MTTSDQAARTRFATAIDQNFSVIASAGSGKTTAITQRVLAIAESAQASDLLPRLAVVTFTNRAADEMQQRARQLLLANKLKPPIQSVFNRAFFGTIHSFCMKLLSDFGHYLGLPAPLELVEDDAEIWREFVQGYSRIGYSLGEQNRAALLRLVQTRDLMELARRAGSTPLSVAELAECPKLDFAEVYAEVEDGRGNITKSQTELRQWEKRYDEGWEYLRWPVSFTATNSRFTATWNRNFAPLRKWISDAALCVAAQVQRDYREFRLERGLVTYGDQIALARELLQHPVAGPRIRAEQFRVILDEAQDTEPAQFAVLVEAARPPSASGEWMQTHVDPPQPGHFCMVGDFQQSIYRDRADLPYYQAVHNALVESGAGEALTFSVTFRLDQRQLHFVNETFRNILNAKDGQVRFVELHPRPEILPGNVLRLHLDGKTLLTPGKKLKDYQKARIEADYLAKWLKQQGPDSLGADLWRDVAILCPRKAWLQTLAAALRRAGLPVSIQSERDVKGDSPAYAWLTALLTIMTDPGNAYEIVGVLREIFGVSDHDLAVFCEGHGNRFQIDKPIAAAGKISSHLRVLADIRQKIDGLALFDAVAMVVDETDLRQRLGLLPAAEFGDLGRELDALLAQAAKGESEGMISREFAELLRDDFTSPRAVRFAADDNAIQLITSHKAKGSEWQAVIVPYLARELRPPTGPYPHLIKSPDTGELVIALGNADKSKELKDAIERAQMQELERLLYVATTRARHTLVIVLDQEIFSNSEGRLPKTAQLRRLVRGGDFYRDEFNATTAECVSPPHPPPAARRPNESVPILAAVDAAGVRKARQRASVFIRKSTPSALDVDEPIEVIGGARGQHPAMFYGRWWHRFFEQVDWRGGAESAQALFDRHLADCPEPERAADDWQATRAALFANPILGSFIARDAVQFRREFPFSWRVNQNAVLEGFIDALMIDPAANECLLVDWKTNRVSSSEAEALRARYLPQLAGYWKAVSAVTGLKVSAALFSTALGRVLAYEPAELSNEWQRLEQLPPQRLEIEIRPDEL